MLSLRQRRHAKPLPALCALALAVTLAVGCGRASYDLTVHITDLEGNPLPGAMVGLSENGQTLLADVKGQVTWKELDETQASLVVVAEGYVLQTTVISLERGWIARSKPAVVTQSPGGTGYPARSSSPSRSALAPMRSASKWDAELSGMTYSLIFSVRDLAP